MGQGALLPSFFGFKIARPSKPCLGISPGFRLQRFGLQPGGCSAWIRPGFVVGCCPTGIVARMFLPCCMLGSPKQPVSLRWARHAGWSVRSPQPRRLHNAALTRYGHSGSGNLSASFPAGIPLMKKPSTQPQAPLTPLQPDEVVERTRALLDLTLEHATRQLNIMVDQAEQSSSHEGDEGMLDMIRGGGTFTTAADVPPAGPQAIREVQIYGRRTVQELRRIADESLALLGEGALEDISAWDLSHITSMDPDEDAERERVFWQVQRYLEEAIADLRHAVSLARHRLVTLTPCQRLTESAAVQELRYMTEEAIQEVRQAAAALRAAQDQELGRMARSLVHQIQLQLSAAGGRRMTVQMQQTHRALLIDLQTLCHTARKDLCQQVQRLEQPAIEAITAAADECVKEIRQAMAGSAPASTASVTELQAMLARGGANVHSATGTALRAVRGAKAAGQEYVDGAGKSARKVTSSAVAELRDLQRKEEDPSYRREVFLDRVYLEFFLPALMAITLIIVCMLLFHGLFPIV